MRYACALLLVVAGCTRQTPYERMLQRERARSDTVSSLFLSYELGMTRQAFYDSSWALNRRGLVMQGPRNLNVQYRLDDTFPHAATMLFYPDFDSDRVIRMRVRFSYDAWAPWNRHLWSDSLLLHVRDLAVSWYGDGFLDQRERNAYGDATRSFVKIDANRHVSLTEGIDHQEVLMTITDLRAIPQ